MRIHVAATGVLIAIAVLAGCGGEGNGEGMIATATLAASGAVAAEANDSTMLPGEYVDLSSMYGGAYPETAHHVRGQVDYSVQGVNPPVGGPHWSAPCGTDPSTFPSMCGPVPWGIYREPWEVESLVHNMEHGGVVVWYNVSDLELRGRLEDVVRDLLEERHLVVIAPYPALPDGTIAVTAWSRIDKFGAADFTPERVMEFVRAHDRRFNPETF
jgi:hypothetical protein